MYKRDGGDSGPYSDNSRTTSGAEWIAAGLVLAAPFLLKLHIISGLLIANPLYFYSGLAVQLEPAWAHSAPTIDPNIGFTSHALGHLAAVDVLSGRMPWWNPYEGAGVPLAGEMQSAALFPLTLLLYFQDGQLYEQIILQAIAGLFTFLLLRRLNVSNLAAVAGALAFEFNGTFSWLANAVINPIAFLPMVIFGIELLRPGEHGQRRFAGSVWISLGLALSLYAGFPEVAYLNGLFISCWLLVRLCTGDVRRSMDLLFQTFLAGLSGLLIAAPILIAFFDFLPYAFVGGHHGDGFARVHIARDHLAHLFLPYLSGGIFRTTNPSDIEFWADVGGYGGVALIALGLAGAMGSRDRGLRVVLLLWTTIAVASCYDLMSVNTVLSAVPGFGSIALYRYLPPSFEFALAVLAALAIDDAVRFATARRAWALIAGVLCSFALLSVALYWAWENPAPDGIRPIWITASLGLAAVLLFSMLAVALVPVSPRYRGACLAGLLVGEAALNFLLPTPGNARHSQLDFAGVRFLRDQLGLQRFYAIGGVLQPNYGAYFQIASINHNDLPLPADWVRFVAEQLDDNAPEVLFTGFSRRDPAGTSASDNFVRNLHAYEDVGVRYVVVPTGRNPFGSNPPALLPQVHTDPLLTIYELPGTRPYFSAEGCELSVHSRESVTANCVHPAQLTRLEMSLPGWHSSVNGHAQPVGKATPIFQEIDLPAGKAEVEFSFLPPFMWYGFLCFIAGVALLFSPLIYRNIKKS